jgi:phage-related protein
LFIASQEDIVQLNDLAGLFLPARLGNALWTGVQYLITGICIFVAMLIFPLTQTMPDITSQLGNGVREAAGNLGNGMKEAAGNMANGARGAAEELGSGLKGARDNLGAGMSKAADNMGDGMKGAQQNLEHGAREAVKVK